MNFSTINQKIQPQKDTLLQHSLYEKVKTLDDLHKFLECHVYAVWDFMSLLKALQNKLTCTITPWFATENPQTRYLINEIVLAEESDLTLDGRRLSHFEMYMEAMQSCGAKTKELNKFLHHVIETKNVFISINQSDLHPNIKAFLDFTFRVIEEGKVHKIAAAFTFGREDLIPAMFIGLVNDLNQKSNGQFSTFKYYLERHIEVDGDHHSHLALAMTEELCGNDETKIAEAEFWVKKSLQARLELWDGILQSLPEQAKG